MAALSEGRKMKDGGDIMLFVYENSSYTSVAHASSHTLSLSVDSEEINTKDAGGFAWTEPGKINWEISVDSFYTNEGYNFFMGKLLSQSEFKVLFGPKAEAHDSPSVNTEASGDGNWTPSTSSYIYYGQAVITSLDWTAAQGSKSTFSATLAGKGSLSYTTSGNFS